MTASIESFRDISADAAHVSLLSLERHYTENERDGCAVLALDPELDEVDMKMTLIETGISMVIATLMLMKTKEKTDLWTDFRNLLNRYNDLT